MLIPEKPLRGMITDEIAALGTDMLGHPMTQLELRLFPYIQYCAINNEQIDIRKTTEEEREILRGWEDKGFGIFCSVSQPVALTREFWDFTFNVLWESYATKAIEFDFQGGDTDGM